MKIIISLFLASVLLFSIADAAQVSNKQLAKRNVVSDILKGILECLFSALQSISKEELPIILQQLQEALGTLTQCLDPNGLDNILALVECIVENLGQISAEDLAVILEKLQPVLSKVSGILKCIGAVIKKICKVDICGFLSILCIEGPLNIITNLLASLIKGLLNGLCGAL